MKEAFINRHLDDVHFNPPPSRNLMNSLSISSPQRSQKQPQQQPHQKPITAPQSSQPKQLPNLNYHLYNETKLRAKLRELGIPNSGNKPMMEKRHREWLTLWNANCDATHPKSKNELLRQLNEWERAEERQFNLNHYNTNPRDSQVQNKKFDRDQWAKRHEGDFEHLIANARKNAQKNKEALAKKQKAEESKDQQVGFTDSGPAPQQESTAQPSNKESNATPEILYTQQPQTLPVTGPQESASEEGGMLPLMPVSNMPRHQPNSREMTVEELREFGQLPPWEPTFRPDYARDDAGFLRHLPQEDGVPPLEDYLSEARDAR